MQTYSLMKTKTMGFASSSYIEPYDTEVTHRF